MDIVKTEADMDIVKYIILHGGSMYRHSLYAISLRI